jgi:hypothetical protein
MRLAWIRPLPSIIASSLLFGFIGTPLGTAVFFIILHLTADKTPSYRGLVDFLIGPGFVIAVIAGAAPALVAGIISGVLRIDIRALWLLACVMAPVGAAMTALYSLLLNALFGWHGLPKQGEVIVTGGIAAFCCTFLLWRNRPWLIPPR